MPHRDGVPAPTHVTSLKDPRVAEARELASGRGRLRHGKVLLHGVEHLEWARREGARLEHVFVVEEAARTLPGWVAREAPILLVSDGLSKKITDTHYLVPVVAVARLAPPQCVASADLTLVLDDLRDAGNVGTLVRTARGFGVREIWSTALSFDPFSRKAIDASRGLVFSTRFHRRTSAEEAAAALKAAGYEIVATSPHAPELQSQVRLAGRPLALVVGNETSGVSDALLAAASRVVQIPMRGVESLNVAVATGISLYELKYKLVLSMMVDSIRGTFGRDFGGTHEAIHLLLDRKLREVGQLGADEVVFLMRLACDRTSALADVAADTRREGPALREFLARLAIGRWIAFPDGVDGERVAITGEGEALLAQLWPVIESAHDVALAGLGEEQQSLLRIWLRTIQENCRSALSSVD